MGLVAEYRLSYRHLPLVDVATAVPELTLRLEVGQPNQGGPPPFIVRATAEGDGFEAFEESPFVREYALVTATDGSHLYQLVPARSMDEQLGSRVEHPERLRALASNESVVERITVTPEGWIQKRRFANRDAFEEYCAFWRENGNSFSLLRLAETDGESSAGSRTHETSRPPMTDRQREALVTAYEMGYFEIPRRATLADVATELGIAAPSLSERLRRAQTHLVEDLAASRSPPTVTR